MLSRLSREQQRDGGELDEAQRAVVEVDVASVDVCGAQCETDRDEAPIIKLRWSFSHNRLKLEGKK